MDNDTRYRFKCYSCLRANKINNRTGLEAIANNLSGNYVTERIIRTVVEKLDFFL
jgi:hypothetical protein